MSVETRERVEQAIAKLKYRPNTAARGLRRSHHYCIALIVVDSRPAFLSHPAHHHVVAGLLNYLNSKGYVMAIEGVAPAPAYDLSYLDRLSTDGLCLIPSGTASARLAPLKRLQSMGQPISSVHIPTYEMCWLAGKQILAAVTDGHFLHNAVALLPRGG
jgi:DNA-binding LacI/PurR family transcriptional regulator